MTSKKDSPEHANASSTEGLSLRREKSPPEYDARALVGEGREACILHEGERYRLRITSNNKLILTK